LRADPKGRRYIDVGKSATAKQKAMLDTASVCVGSYNVASRVDRTRKRTSHQTSRYINGGEDALAQQITMPDALAIEVEPKMSPCGLIPVAGLNVDPGTLIVENVPLLRRKPTKAWLVSL
jgi:hypothetical protein